MSASRKPSTSKTDPGARKTRAQQDAPPLKYGWTTGACAAAAAKAALIALTQGAFPEQISIRLPKGQTPVFDLVNTKLGDQSAECGIIKDAGDDPDVTHGVEVRALLTVSEPGSGLRFAAGEGVGHVTKAGLPIEPGEPAINPGPRAIIRDNLQDAADEAGIGLDFNVTLSIPGGEEIAQKTWNPRLGIIGGLSILGTTGIVHPFSCSAWIHSIHRGIDVARADGLSHIVGATGTRSEDAAQARFNLPDHAMIDMGDFVGGMLKYARRHPVPRITIAGGFAKMVKLAQGSTDLHSARSQVDFTALSETARKLGAEEPLIQKIRDANTAAEVLSLAADLKKPSSLPEIIARQARETALATLGGGRLDVLIVDRNGTIIASTEDALVD